VQLVSDERFGQIFITDTDRQHLTTILAAKSDGARMFAVANGAVKEIMG
jgi:DNA replication and repair protein RecF